MLGDDAGCLFKVEDVNVVLIGLGGGCEVGNSADEGEGFEGEGG